MPAKLKSLFSYGFTHEDLMPMMQVQRMLQQDSVINTYLQQSLLSENIIKRQRDMDQASVRAQAITETTTKASNNRDSGKEKETSSVYAITYYNPELQKTEVLEARSEIRIKDIATRMIEESVAMGSTLPIYKFITSPLMRKEVQPWKLEQILSEREYGTPPPPPAGAAVTPLVVIIRKEIDTAAEKRREEQLEAAVSESILRKERSELKIDEEIMLLEEAVAALRAGENIDKVLDRLPPLSRARYILAMRKRLLGKQAIIKLLLLDASFLKTIKKKLELFTLDDLVSMYKALRGLQKR